MTRVSADAQGRSRPEDRAVATVTHRQVETNGLTVHVAEAGDGPLVVLIHGVPELNYWRHQLAGLAESGYHVVAPDLSGCGRTDAPPGVERYSMLHLVSDVVGLLDALGEEAALVVGHDWGANVAYRCAELHPSCVGARRLERALRTSYARAPERDDRTVRGRRLLDGPVFQQPGVAEAELEADPHRAFRLFLYGRAGDGPGGLVEHLYTGKPPGARLLDDIPEPALSLPWLTEADVGYYASEYGRTGFTGALNRYRNLDRDGQELAVADGATIEQPALFIGGSRDGAVLYGDLDRMQKSLPNMRRVECCRVRPLVQQERAREVNAPITQFFSHEAPAGLRRPA